MREGDDRLSLASLLEMDEYKNKKRKKERGVKNNNKNNLIRIQLHISRAKKVRFSTSKTYDTAKRHNRKDVRCWEPETVTQ